MAETLGYERSPSTSERSGFTGTIRYPWPFRYLATAFESRSGLSESPTTAIVRA